MPAIRARTDTFAAMGRSYKELLHAPHSWDRAAKKNRPDTRGCGPAKHYRVVVGPSRASA